MQQTTHHHANSTVVIPFLRPTAEVDAVPYLASLQTTLDLAELLSLFFNEAARHTGAIGLSYCNPAIDTMLQYGAYGAAGCSRHTVTLTLNDIELGELSFYREGYFSFGARQRLDSVSQALLYPLRNALLYHDALQSASRDPLTGIGNRSALDDALLRTVNLAHRHQQPLSLVIIDLDHFKRINDTYGHATGDVVLRDAAQRIHATLRGGDQLFRYGGEEFVAILDNTDLVGAMSVAERIRKKMAADPCRQDGRRPVTVTASMGVAQLLEGDSAHSLFDKADHAMYRAKHLGRNQVVIHE